MADSERATVQAEIHAMNFEAFKEFKRKTDTKIEDVSNYLSGELAGTLRGLRAGLQKLKFTENFECFEEELTIAAGAEAVVRNMFRDKPPTRWLAVRKNAAALSVCDGDTAWSTNYVYLKNTHATDTAILTVLFFK